MARTTNNEEQEDKSIRSKEMLIITYVFVTLFLGLIGYLIYYQTTISEDVINSPYNRKRQEILAQSVIRGPILSADGKVLAETVHSENGTEIRSYPYANMFSHVVGYSANGGSGLEAYNNIRLLRSDIFFGNRLLNDLNEEKSEGDCVITTLNYKLQDVAYEAMGHYEGAVFVMEPSTGKILAMVSKPDYDPNKIESIWDKLVAKDSSESMLLNRATQGLYPPGSTFKMITTVEYMRENNNYKDYTFHCTGKYEYDGNVINCYHSTVHGDLDLTQSFAKSCNSSFVNIGMQLNRKKLAGLCDDLLFNQDISVGIASKSSRYTANADTSTYKMMQTVIGQGDTLVTPMQMGMVVSAIANHGTMMQPYLVDHIESASGNTIQTFRPKKIATPFSESECREMTTLMKEVVESGTATKLSGTSYTVAGKTGSAEFGSEKGHSHAWFVGFTDEENSIAVSIILEDAGSGGSTAAPIAKKIFDAYYNQ